MKRERRLFVLGSKKLIKINKDGLGSKICAIAIMLNSILSLNLEKCQGRMYWMNLLGNGIVSKRKVKSQEKNLKFIIKTSLPKLMMTNTSYQCS